MVSKEVPQNDKPFDDILEEETDIDHDELFDGLESMSD